MESEEQYEFAIACKHKASYEVLSVNGVLELDNPTLAAYCGMEKALVCVDENVLNTYGEKIGSYFSSFRINHRIIPVRADEHNKTIGVVIELCRTAKEFGLGRRSLVVAIGGGITMDIAGVGACLYRRGIKVIRVPTTLLGMIDAGIGIKWGVNFEGERNFLGAFYPPLVTLNDIGFLRTLSDRAIRDGLSELIKIAVVRDAVLFSKIEEHLEEFKGREISPQVKQTIRMGIKAMLDELQPNLYEERLERLADFGHAFSPAIEFASNHEVTHGEAVSIDMAISTELAHLRKTCYATTKKRILNLLHKAGLPLFNDCCTVELLWQELPEIAAHRGGRLNLVAPKEIGVGTFIQTLTWEELKDALAHVKHLSEEVSGKA